MEVNNLIIYRKILLTSCGLIFVQKGLDLMSVFSGGFFMLGLDSLYKHFKSGQINTSKRCALEKC